MSESRAITVFICDDSEVTYLGLKCTIERLNLFQIVGYARDGLTAVEEVLRLTPDVILMDIGLPGITGIETTKRIKSHLPAARIIMLTAAEDEQTIAAALAAGATGYCLKTVFTTQLAAAIESVSGGVGWLDPCIAGRILPILGGRVLVGNSVSKLTRRELEVLSLIVEGLGNEAIAERLYLSIDTVKTHMRHIFEKLDVKDRTQAAIVAMKQGLPVKESA